MVRLSLAGKFSVVELFVLRPAYGDRETTGRIEFVEEFFPEFEDTLAVGGNADQVVTFVGIGLQVVETVAVPHAVVEDVLFAVRPNRESRGGGGKVPFPMIFVNEMLPPFFLVLLPLEQGKKKSRALRAREQRKFDTTTHEGERFVSYLPLSHVAAQLSDLHCPMSVAATVCFARPDALKVVFGT